MQQPERAAGKGGREELGEEFLLGFGLSVLCGSGSENTHL